jgi:hypothetical protein
MASVDFVIDPWAHGPGRARLYNASHRGVLGRARKRIRVELDILMRHSERECVSRFEGARPGPLSQ